MIAGTQKAVDYSQAETAASEWHTLLASGDATDADRKRFNEWLDADPEHRRLYDLHGRAWGAIAEMQHLSYLKDAPAPFLKRFGARLLGYGWTAPVAAAASLTLIIVAYLFVMDWRQGGARAPDHATQVAEIRDIILDDGSMVTLGGASALEVAFTDRERRVKLSEGEAFFAIEKDRVRPFIVVAGDTEVRVLGTKFDVHHGTAAVRVSVLEGKVEVTKPDQVSVPNGPASRQLFAGQKVISAKAGAIEAPQTVETDDVAPWREGRLVYVDAYLKDIIDDVNRYYEGEIRVADEVAGQQQLSLAFRTDQIDRMLEVLTTALPVEAQRSGGDRIILRSISEAG